MLWNEFICYRSHTHIRQHIQSLEEEYKYIGQVEKSLPLKDKDKFKSLEMLLDCKVSLSFCLEKLQKLLEESEPSLHRPLSLNPLSVSANMCTSMDDAIFSFQKRSTFNETGSEVIIKPAESYDNERYLCVTDGFVIYCLDLKWRNDDSKDRFSGIQPLPTISTLKLLEKGLPVSMGLFKWRSNAYMVGGQVFTAFKKHPDFKLPHWLYAKYDFKGSSRKTYHLSLVEGDLCLCECDAIPLLKKPKVWPTVEKIGNQIYVIESVPEGFEPPKIVPTLEVLTLNDDDDDDDDDDEDDGVKGGWIKLPSMLERDHEVGFVIKDHLALGHLICARVHGSSRLFVLDCQRNEWELRKERGNHVMRAFGFGNGICVGEIVGTGYKGPLYVVIGIGDASAASYTNEYDDEMGVKAQAHLVRLTGEVVYSQDLPHLVKGLYPEFDMLQAKLFSVDQDKEILCALVLTRDSESGLKYLHISTFTVYSLLSEHDNDDVVDQENAVDKDFVEVVLKDSHVYQVGTELTAEGDETTSPPRLDACFLQ